MYIPKHFEKTEPEFIHNLIRSAPLGTLVVNTSDGLVANHIPFVLTNAEAGATQLLAHIPRANPLSSMLIAEHECVAIFYGPEGYISPSLYATKQEHSKVVPTWNYAVVHAHGKIRVIDDAAWVTNQLELLTEQSESQRSKPWAVSDAPEEFVKSLIKSLVGLELTVTRIESKLKASQNQPVRNQQSILATLDRESPDTELTGFMHSVLDKTS